MGCSDLSDIDRRTDDLVRQRSLLLGGEGLVPMRTFHEPSGIDDARVRAEEPNTLDPSVSALRFVPADEARDVADRLNKFTEPASEGKRLDLTSALRTAQTTGRELLNAEEEYLLAAIRLLIERHRWDPQFFASITPQFVDQYIRGATNTTALQVVNELRVTQRLPYGGAIEARYLYSLTEQLRQRVGERFTDSSALILDATIPLLRGAGDIARETLIQSERDLVYAARTFEDFRRTYLVQIARDYFALVQQQRAIENQQNALTQLRNLEQRTSALVEAGRLAEFQKNIASNDVLVATSRLAQQRETFTLALDRFKVRLGVGVNEPVIVVPESLEVPEPDITPGEAARVALEFRLDLQTQRDRVDDQRRAVRNAKNGLLPDLNLFANAQLNATPLGTSQVAIVNPDTRDAAAGVTFGLPLDRETERLTLRSAVIVLEQNQRALEQARDNVVVDARARVREIERARFALQLQERAVFINKRRLEEQQLKVDTVTAQEVVDTANALRDAENARDQAVTDLRNAVLDYLLGTGQLRVGRDGQLLRIPGMELAAPSKPVKPVVTDPAAPTPATSITPPTPAAPSGAPAGVPPPVPPADTPPQAP
ncbi:TolC family protein [soil metagenome]